jgi:peptidyl-tRNA hydrolase, PTH1 family
MNSFLIAGLGNIGDKYEHTRHNIGFDILDACAAKWKVPFNNNRRYGSVAEHSLKGRSITLLKPSTYVNLSGKAVRYWLQEANVPIFHLLVVQDELALPFGTLRMKAFGSDGGHNGLKNIQEIMQTPNYARLRFGIENKFPKGGQVDYVLGKWSEEEQNTLPEHIAKAVDAIESFCLIGIERTMNIHNTKK